MGWQEARLHRHHRVNRKDWGLEWNPLDGRGVLVSDNAKVTLEVEAVKS